MLHNSRLRPILIIILLLLALTACNQDTGEETPTAEADPTGIEYIPFDDDALGLKAEYPADWVTHAAFGGATFASAQSAIDAESISDIGEEGFVVVIPGEISYFNFQTAQEFDRSDILRALATYKALLEREGQQYVTLEPPQSFTSESQDMARMVLRSDEDGKPLITIMAVVMTDTHMALISAASLETTAEKYQPIFDKIIESIKVRPPAALGVTPESE